MDESYKLKIEYVPLDRAAKIGPVDELKLDEMRNLYGYFVTIPGGHT